VAGAEAAAAGEVTLAVDALSGARGQVPIRSVSEVSAARTAFNLCISYPRLSFSDLIGGDGLRVVDAARCQATCRVALFGLKSAAFYNKWKVCRRIVPE
jgi:hypothetical protein